MAINISILGSTGSIGTQTLSVVDEFKNSINVVGLAAGESIDKVREQTRKYHPKAVSVKKEEDAKLIRSKKGLRVGWGDSGNCMVATLRGVDKVVIATPGLAGIKPTLAAIKAKKTIALATKEVLVAAGDLVTREAKNHKVEIVPIDSEHSAIFQSLGNRSIDEVKRVIITASGGPFRGKKPKDLKNIKVEQALAHPNWKMGRKITIDSATLMNKGFEVIEAMWLFGVPLSKIKVVVHPQSVIHSAVEFIDGSIIAQIGPSDMRLPIQYALFYPGKRKENSFKKFSFSDYSNLSFEEPDIATFRCLGLAYKAIKEGKTAPAVLTAANDVAVEAFLEEKLAFHKIPDVIESVLSRHSPKRYKSLEEILAVDSWARDEALKFAIKFGKR
ncbi:MAG: 1-deoxy-D-xylulose-5-phosphate reductoisomerase [Candidatus Curtissbacteria bacterium]|nr:1-deoxy-D-xylulose-5-phosphate reductoisomerase [Candidatus Curtissbacteria bacterium]